MSPVKSEIITGLGFILRSGTVLKCKMLLCSSICGQWNFTSYEIKTFSYSFFFVSLYDFYYNLEFDVQWKSCYMNVLCLLRRNVPNVSVSCHLLVLATPTPVLSIKSQCSHSRIYVSVCSLAS